MKKIVKPTLGTLTKDFGSAPEGIDVYTPIKYFNPNRKTKGYIIVKMNKTLLTSMLKQLENQLWATDIGVPCKKVQ